MVMSTDDITELDLVTADTVDTLPAAAADDDESFICQLDFLKRKQN